MADVAIARRPDPSSGTIVDRFREVATRFAQRPAVCQDGTMTYRELEQRSDQVAGYLADLAFADSPVIGISLTQIPAAIVALLGVMKTGRAYVFIGADSPLNRKLAVVKAMALEAVIADPGSKPWAGFTGRWIDLAAAAPRSPSGEIPVKILPDAAACIVQTSGSTGEPLGVEISHAALLHTIGGYTSVAGLGPEDRFTLFTSPAHFAAHSAIFGALLNGACLCPFDVKAHGFTAMAAWLEREKLTVYQSPPSLFRAFIRALPPSRRFTAIRFLRLGGETALTRDFALFQKHFSPTAQFAHALGMSEAGGNIALFCPNSDFVSKTLVLPVGRPWTDQEVFVAGPSGAPVAPGETGEIVVRSDYLATGYYRRPDLTAQKFKASPDGSRELWTGDLGHFTPEGWLMHEGRRDDQVKIHGYRVNLAGLETMLQSLPEVREARVLTRPGQEGTDELLAFVLTSDRSVTAESVHHDLAKINTAPVQPRIILVEDFPLHAAGKLDRRRLLRLAAGSGVSSSSVAPRNALEHKLVSLWKTVLDVNQLGVYDDFFSAGGDSLQAIKISAAIERRHRVPFSPHHFLDRRTIAQQAEYIGAHKTGTAPPLWQRFLPPARSERVVLLRARPHRPARPLFICPGGWGHERELLAFAALLPHLPEEIPVYGLKQEFIRPSINVTPSVEGMAQNFLAQIRKIQPVGPYRFVGECIGSIVVLEMARQLLARRQPVETIILLDPRRPTSVPETGSENAPTATKVQLYYRLLAAAALTPFAQDIHIIVGEDAAEDTRPRYASCGLFDLAQLNIIPVPGNHQTYLREHGAEVGRQIGHLLSWETSGRSTLRRSSAATVRTT